MKRVVVSILLSVSVLICSAQSAEDVHQAISKPIPDQRLLREIADKLGDKELAVAIDSYLQDPNAENKQVVKTMSGLRAIALGSNPVIDGSVQKAAQEITAKGGYRKLDQREASNWISKGFEGLNEWLKKLNAGRSRDEASPPISGSNDWLKFAVWALLGGGVLAGLWWVAGRISLKFGRRARRAGVLDDEEPERSADEWLQRAQELEAAGQFRNAVRALYLACLVRFDEHGVAHFIRSETNWEHLKRIRSGRKSPPGLDFEPLTRRFDFIWYGEAPCGIEDVNFFRETYQEVLKRLKGQIAA